MGMESGPRENLLGKDLITLIIFSFEKSIFVISDWYSIKKSGKNLSSIIKTEIKYLLNTSAIRPGDTMTSSL